MRPNHLIDADCHPLEPPHASSEWPAAFRDRAPQVARVYRLDEA